ncbi:UNVERIFIED_CONTAM: E3 ubiquitin-protein ligase RHA2B [Sesamum radiatum]|uniref:E3 ubiquitin-protein ligase RHA2B n=1 Tax=Sesamum radiatum TaxID=300843 RepID=A0AAW2JRF7_SESRA
MGLQNQLADASSESVVVLMVVLIARSPGPLLPGFDPDHQHHFGSSNSLYDVVGSGLASLILLCDQLNLNRACSYPNPSDGVDGLDADCVVCLNRLSEGDRVRELACHHVFHKDCLDGWLDHLNFNCPLCRAPLVSDESVDYTQRRVAGDLLAWFPFH